MAVSDSKTKENLLCHLQICEADSTATHLADLINEVLREKPQDALQNLEKLSSFLKQYRFKQKTAPDAVIPEPLVQRRLNYVESLRRSKVRYTGAAEISNFSDDTAMLRWAGISFGDERNYEISLRIRILAQSLGKSLVKLRFWGKIFGTSYDYFIAEGQLTPPTVEVATDIEPRGKGANSYSYWALSTKPGDDWELLPNVRPSWIVASKLVRKYLTGVVGAQVLGFAPFPTRERGLLRAIIARISAACILAPTGAIIPGEEEGTVQVNPEFEFPATEELKTQAGWIHARDHLLKNGQTTYPEVDPEVDEERAKEIEQQKEDDPIVAALRGISDDVPSEGVSSGWNTSQVGDPASYAFDTLQKSYAVSVVHSTRWPGAYTVAQGKRYCNIYVGYGLRDVGSCFLPLAPGDVQAEPQDDGEEADEPNPEEVASEAVEEENAEGEEQAG